MAALLLGQRLSGLGIRAAVRSAGLEQRGSRPPAPVQQVLRARGLDLQGHRGAVLEAQLLGEADLVLGMGFRHVQAAAHLAPRAWPYTFTLKELVSFDSIVSARRQDEPLEGLLSRVHRARTEPLGGSAQDTRPGGPGDDVPDEIAYSLDACEQEAEELERLIDRLVAFLWRGPMPPTNPSRKIFDDAS
jgi:protein-tyrosine-phosphatase